MKRWYNGKFISIELPVEGWAEKLNSADVEEFALGCMGLQELGTPEAYEVLKSRLGERDKYRRRLILSVIFSFEESAELQEQFREALQSEEMLFVEEAFKHLCSGRNFWVGLEEILTAIERNHNKLHNYYYQPLWDIAKTRQYTDRILDLFHTADTDSIRITVAGVFEHAATEENYTHLYGLLAESKISKLRLEACRIAHRFDRRDLLLLYVNDPDGHIRKFAKKALGDSDGSQGNERST